MCQKVLQFGGVLVSFEASTRSSRKRRNVQDLAVIESFLTSLLNDTESLLEVRLSGSLLNNGDGVFFWNYIAFYETNSGTSSYMIQNTMNTSLNECGNCNFTFEETVYVLNKSATIRNAGNADGVACDEYASCDESTTTCQISDGSLFCSCKSDTVRLQGNAISCTVMVCSSDSDCNAPFGRCEKTTSLGTCGCTALFQGDNCENPWLFIFVIFASTIVFIALIVLSACCIPRMRKRMTKKKKEQVVLTSLYDPKPLEMPDLSLRARVPTDLMFRNQAYDP